MRIKELGDVKIPDDVELNVFGWRFPKEWGEAPSKELFETIEKIDTTDPDTGFGVWRSREQNQATGEMFDWFVWAVDFNFGLLDKMPDDYVDAFRTEPDPETAVRLVLRHVRTMVAAEPGPGQKRHQRSHYGLGALLDAAGQMHVRAGQG